MSETNRQWLQYLISLSSCVLAVSTGLHCGWTSPAIPKLLNHELDFEVSLKETSYIVTIAPFGYVFSAIFNFYFADHIGRKPSLLLLSIPQIIAWILIGTSSNVIMLYISRVLAGMAEGAVYSLLPMYLCEISEPSIRGILGSMFTLGLILGILLINCYGSYISIRLGAFTSISVPLLFVVTFMWMPESPYFYIMKNRKADAKHCLNKLLQKSDVEKELKELTEAVETQLNPTGSAAKLQHFRANVKAFIILLTLRILQQFSGYYVFSSYTQFIFEQSGSPFPPEINSIIYIASHLIFTLLGLFLIDHVGRKLLLLVSLAGTSLALLGEGLYFYFYDHLDIPGSTMKKINWIPIVGMILYSLTFNIGLGVVPNLLTGEMFSVDIKTKALGILIILCAFGVSGSYALFRWLNDSFDIAIAFFVFSCVCFFGIGFSYYFVIETKGKTLEEIQQDLRGS